MKVKLVLIFSLIGFTFIKKYFEDRLVYSELKTNQDDEVNQSYTVVTKVPGVTVFALLCCVVFYFIKPFVSL